MRLEVLVALCNPGESATGINWESKNHFGEGEGIFANPGADIGCSNRCRN